MGAIFFNYQKDIWFMALAPTPAAHQMDTLHLIWPPFGRIWTQPVKKPRPKPGFRMGAGSGDFPELRFYRLVHIVPTSADLRYQTFLMFQMPRNHLAAAPAVCDLCCGHRDIF